MEISPRTSLRAAFHIGGFQTGRVCRRMSDQDGERNLKEKSKPDRKEDSKWTRNFRTDCQYRQATKVR